MVVYGRGKINAAAGFQRNERICRNKRRREYEQQDGTFAFRKGALYADIAVKTAKVNYEGS